MNYGFEERTLFSKQYNVQKIQSLIWGEASFNNVQENLKNVLSYPDFCHSQ